MGYFTSFKQIDLIKEMTGPLLLVCIFSSLGGMNFGIDNAYWGGLITMDQFKKDFGRIDSTTGEYAIPTTWQSVGSGTPSAGVAIGCLISAPISKHLGRKKTFMVLSMIALVGILIQVTAKHFWQLFGGRIVNSLSMGMIASVVPVYQTECAPPAIRGAAINFYQFWQLFGALLAAIINYATYNRADQWAYRTVILVQIGIPVILLIGAFIVPESPRTLLMKKKPEEAAQVLQWLRKGTSEQLVAEEIKLMGEAIEEQSAMHYAATYADCFRGTNRRRTLIAIGVQCFQQFQGSGFILNYVYVFLESIGIQNTYQINIYLYLVNLASASLTFYIADKFGRRPLMIFGAGIETAAMLVVGGLAGVAGAKTSAQQSGALAALFIWLGVQAFAWGSCVWITSAEVGTLQLREKTVTLATFFGFCSAIFITYISPYIQDAGYGNLQGNIGFVWAGTSFVSLLFVLFYLPELKGRSLEELDELFQKRISVFKFGNYQTEGVGAQIRIIEGKMPEVVDKESDQSSVAKHALDITTKYVEAY